MAESIGLSNYDIADIYENVIAGDKGALAKLQQISTKHYVPKFMSSYYNKKSKQNQPEIPPINEEINKVKMSQSKFEKQEFKQVSSVPSMPTNKDQLFLNILKKGARMTPILSQERRTGSKKIKRLVNSSNQYQKQQKIAQSQAKQKKQIKDLKQDLAKEIDISLSIDKPPTRNKNYMLPKVHKNKESIQIPKIQSTHLEPQKKILASNVQKSQVSIKPKEKIDFKEVIGKNRKQRQDFEKANLQQRSLQMEIMDFHNSTKNQLDNIKLKYNIQFNKVDKYLTKRKRSIDDNSKEKQLKQTQSQKKLSPFKKNMKNETDKCAQISSEIAHLNNLINKHNSQIRKLQREKQSYPFNQFLDRFGFEIQEQLQQEADEVEPLMEEGANGHKYKYSMAHTREKKWSLLQRTQYEAQRTHSLDESRKANTTSRNVEKQIKDHKEIDNDYKVTVNQRLKNLLFS